MRNFSPLQRILSGALTLSLLAGPALASGNGSRALAASQKRTPAAHTLPPMTLQRGDAQSIERARAALQAAVEKYEHTIKFMPGDAQAEFNAKMAADFGDFEEAKALRKGSSVHEYFFAWDNELRAQQAQKGKHAATDVHLRNLTGVRLPSEASRLAGGARRLPTDASRLPATRYAWAQGRGIPYGTRMPALIEEAHAVAPLLIGACVLLALGALYTYHLLSADRHPTAVGDMNAYLAAHPRDLNDPGFPNLLNKNMSVDPDLGNFHVVRDSTSGCHILTAGGGLGQGETIGYFNPSLRAFQKEAISSCP